MLTPPPNYPNAEPDGPPLRECKQPMAMHKASPHSGPIIRFKEILKLPLLNIHMDKI